MAAPSAALTALVEPVFFAAGFTLGTIADSLAPKHDSATAPLPIVAGDAALQVAVVSLVSAYVLREADPFARMSFLAGVSFYGGVLLSQPEWLARVKIVFDRTRAVAGLK